MSQPTLVLLYAPDPAMRPGAVTLALPRGSTVVVGRSGEADLVIPDPRVSRRHANITWDGEHVRVENVSENGTSIDGARFASGEVVDGDVLRFGDAFVLLRFEPVPPVPDTVVAGVGGISPAMRRIRAEILAAAGSPGPLRIGGPSGVGKRAVARIIHEHAGRPGALVAVDHAREEDVASAIAAATGGSVYIANVASLSPSMTALLREPQGTLVIVGTRSRFECPDGLFAHTIVVPPLRRRREDVLPYVLRIVDRPAVDLGPELVAGLLRHLWPYNVRELSKVAHALSERGAGLPKLSLDLIRDGLAFIGGAADQTLPATSISIEES